MYDVAIIGAGISGTCIARELSKYNVKAVLIEKDTDVANGTTKANSAIVHAGYDAKPGTLKAKFNVLGNAMFDQLCEELQVPFKRIGSFVVAFNEEEMKTLQELYEKGLKNGVPDMEIISGEQVLAMEPNLSPSIVGALHAKTGGIVGPWELAIAAAENAVDNGVEIKLESQVTNIEKIEGGYRIFMGAEQLDTKYVINCAGLYADEIHNMVAPPAFKILPRRGQYNIFDKSVGNFVNKVVFPCPNEFGKGVLVAPTVHGNLLVGPDAEDLEDRTALNTTAHGLGFIRDHSVRTAEKIPFNAIITAFAGLRARPDTGDFIIEEVQEAKGFIDVAGIESPGLTAAPAIAVYVVELLQQMAGFEKKDNFNPHRREVVHFMDLTNEEKAAMIQKDPRYGRIICRCENITEGEIVDVIKRSAGARTVDGVKRRARPGSGRCQGGFCGPRVMEILAREMNIEIVDVVKDSRASYILTEPTKQTAITEETMESVAASKEQ
ncbi:glycerol-3-phosphate dehydrogenase [Geosporobacter subterraneus DSM 17957]|uniref:Glycerol-3-phosphate dehydrogenase n=1 Tax=Geosporobacter subterraneus DSM 17957 TaxID=1121919 RepID=A0A1M6J3J1_9FIRM|nr:NAD(P)/FAD-dependent oxidoreductase [Geosporobacter subterraneus]SHJ41258.1 glycerol-3-phosphate dehydrogenase [Geosporobacter subterraneus DSM 17957]